MGESNIIIAGDLVPTASNYEIFAHGTSDEMIGNRLGEIWHGADFRVANLEAPIIDVATPIKKAGPNLKIPTKCVHGFSKLDISMLGMANNHVMDFGEKGIRSTFELLQKYKIQYVGAGNNRQQSGKGKIIKINGIKIGFYACSEHEFSAAGRRSPGANAIGINTCLHIREVKDESDYLIVLFHGGKEHYPHPTPEQSDRCHCFVDAGADIVICQHSHCIGCDEMYNGKHIIYGQGNFIFDDKDDECWKSGILVNIFIKKDACGELTGERVEYVPIIKNGPVIRLADAGEREKIFAVFNKNSKQIEMAEALFHQVAWKDGPSRLRNVAGWGKVLRGMDRIILKDKLIHLFFSDKKISRLRGVYLCETDMELLETYFKLCSHNYHG